MVQLDLDRLSRHVCMVYDLTNTSRGCKHISQELWSGKKGEGGM